MTIAATAPIIEYAGSGAATPLAVPFRFFANADLIVTKIVDGVETVLVSGTDYSVSGADSDSGGTVTPLAPIPTGTSWKIERITARIQQTDFVDGNNFPSEAHENGLDRLMAIEQEQDVTAADTRARAPLVPSGEYAPDFASLDALEDGDLLEYRGGKFRPFDHAPYAGKFFAGDATGRPVPASGTEGADEALRADLASVIGASLSRFTQIGGDPAAQSVEEKLRQNVDTRDYGTKALTLANWQISKAHRDDIVCDARQSGMISLVDGDNNRGALQDMDAWSEAKGGKKILLPTGSYPMDGTFEPSGENSYDASGGSRSQTVIELQATDAPGWWCKERSVKIKGIHFDNSETRRDKAVTDINVVDLLIGDIDGGATTISRVELEDLYFTQSAYASLMIMASWELGFIRNISGADGLGFGMIMDDATRLGYAAKKLGAFMTTSANIRFFEYALKGAILGHPAQTNRGLHNIFNIIECLGCCWDRATLTSLGLTTHQMDIHFGNTRLIQPDFEDQQYNQSLTSSTGMARTANLTPAKGIQALSTGGHIEGGHFSSLLSSGDILAPGWNVIGNPIVFAGTYGVAMPYAFQFAAAATGFIAEGKGQSGATVLFDFRNEFGRVFYDGYEFKPTSSSVLGAGIRMNKTPIDTVISGGILTGINHRVVVRGEGAVADSLATLRRASGLNGVGGDEMILYPGAETITLVHGSVIDNPAAVDRALSRPTPHIFQTNKWFGAA